MHSTLRTPDHPLDDDETITAPPEAPDTLTVAAAPLVPQQDRAAVNKGADGDQRRFDGIGRVLPPPLDFTDAVGLVVEPGYDTPSEPEDLETDINRVPTPMSGAHPDSIENPVDANPTVETSAGGFATPPVEMPRPQLTRRPRSTHELVAGGPRLLRDRFALLEIARYRLLSFRQIQAQVFGDLNKAVLTRRMQALQRAGFIETWEEHLVLGGHPRYAIPTKQGLSWALEELIAEAKGTPSATLVQAMVGEAGKRPLVLAPRTAPPFLPHQEETNRVVAALEAIPALGISWASTWHRPFPNHIDRIPLPQPDGVLVATQGGKPHLVFLEHDRGQEAPASFAKKKAERYHALSLYGLSKELFGFGDFTVWVTVTDVAERKPLQRIRALQAVSTNARMMRFTLAGWIPPHAHARPIWFTPRTSITTMERGPDAHDGLVGPFAAPHDAATDDPAADLLRRFRTSQRARPIEDDDPDDPFAI